MELLASQATLTAGGITGFGGSAGVWWHYWHRRLRWQLMALLASDVQLASGGITGIAGSAGSWWHYWLRRLSWQLVILLASQAQLAVVDDNDRQRAHRCDGVGGANSIICQIIGDERINVFIASLFSYELRLNNK